LTDTSSVVLQPQIVVLTFDSSPPGLNVAVGGAATLVPFTRTVIVGSANSVSAPSPQLVDGRAFGFRSWSDGGPATHILVAPASPTMIVATFKPLVDLVLTSVPSSTRVVRNGRL